MIYALLITIIFTLGAILVMQSFTLEPIKRPSRQRKLKVSANVWSDVVDDLLAGVRAGMSLPQAVGQLGDTGPLELREYFNNAAMAYNQHGDFNRSMIQLSQKINQPTCDKFVSALVMAHQLGGTDLGRLLSTLSDSLRVESSIKGEIVARQSWTVNGARLAIAAPWLTVVVLSARPDARMFYFSGQGIRLMAFCLAVSVFAYLCMQKIARLPQEPRLLRQS